MEDNEDRPNAGRHNVISLMDSFIEQLLQARKTLVLALSLSISSIILCPLAIGLSIFLVTHRSFFAVLERESEFGLFLFILLIGIIIVSSIWFISGLKEYRSIKVWNEKYRLFRRKKEEIDKHIVTEYGLDDE
jgi:hypothetical protein